MTQRGDELRPGVRRRSAAGGRPSAARGGELPLPILLALAVVAVLGERLWGSRQKPLLVAAALLACVVIGGFGTRVVERAETPPTVSARSSPPGEMTATAEPTAEPPWPTATFPAVIGASLSDPTATTAPTPAAVATRPSATTNTPTPSAAIASDTPRAPTATATPTPRGTTVIPILMYHYVRTVTDKKDTLGINLSVTPATFAAQMKYLADNGYTTLTMREVHAILAGTLPLPPKPIALTFDDGYRDFYTAAWPVLRQYNFKATNYVVTGFIGQEPYLTWAMIQELDASGQVEIGAHTRTHADLRAIGKDKRWDEIVGSKAILEEGLGHPIVSFCYPAGFHNADVVADVKRAGYLTATTVAHGTKQSVLGAFEMPRIRVHGPDPLGTWAGKLP